MSKNKRLLIALLATLMLVGLVFLVRHYYLGVTSGRDASLLKKVANQLDVLMENQQVRNYDIQVELKPERGVAHLTTVVRLNCKNKPRRNFYFLLNHGFHLNSVKIDDRTLRFWRLWLLTWVRLPHPIEPGQEVVITFDYEGAPQSTLSISPGYITPEETLFSVDEFWYPTDVQGFFTASLTLKTPSDYLPVCTGTLTNQETTAGSVITSWEHLRQIGGMALLAGYFHRASLRKNSVDYSVFTTAGVEIDDEAVLQALQASDEFFAECFGPSGFFTYALVVSGRMRRGFHDGSGMIGLSRDFLRGRNLDFGLIVHEMAHNWWGGTVSEDWLNSRKKGGEWIVEGFAEASSLSAVEKHAGKQALIERLKGETYDPVGLPILEDVSVIDNMAADRKAMTAIYQKGAYVTLMLRQILGDSLFYETLRQFVSRCRYRFATGEEFQAVAESVSGKKLDWFFNPWLRSTGVLDFAIESVSTKELGSEYETTVLVANRGNMNMPVDVELRAEGVFGVESRMVPMGLSPTPVHFQTEQPITRISLDPDWQWADINRENNFFCPTQEYPEK